MDVETLQELVRSAEEIWLKKSVNSHHDSGPGFSCFDIWQKGGGEVLN